MKKSIFRNRVIIFIVLVSLMSCLKQQFEELQEEMQSENDDFQSIFVSDPTIWNTLAIQSISLDDSNDNALLKSTQNEKEYPGHGKYYYTLFEDLYPSKGDYDFNDVIIRSKLFLNNDKDDVTGKIETELVHLGGGITTKLGVMFYETDGKKKYKRIPNEDITINEVTLEKGGNPYTLLLPTSASKNNKWELAFSFKKEEMKDVWINYFLITRNNNRTLEILTSGFASSGFKDEFEVPTTDFLSEDNKPWGFEIEASEMPVVKEKENFCKAFPEFANWVNEPDKKENKKWYERPDEAFIQGVK